jgi:hypothetical protein
MKKGKRAEVMLKLIWSHNTSLSMATNFSPFWLLFGAEVITLEENTKAHKQGQRTHSSLPKLKTKTC